jgi:predicted nucleic acid-binding Zn ribbon protein
MRRREAQSVGSILNELLKTQRLDGKLNEVRLLENWEKVLGNNIAVYTKNKYIKNKVLFVNVSSSALRSELMMARSHLVEMLNKSVGTTVITEIVFK